MKLLKYQLVFLCIFCNLIAQELNAQQNGNYNDMELSQINQLNSNNFFVDSNKYKVATPTNDNIIKINQVGTNDVNLKIKQGDSQTVNQLGTNNYYEYINYFNSNPSNFNILQSGTANSLQIYGENSIVKNLGVIQKGNFKSIIIKNY